MTTRQDGGLEPGIYERLMTEGLLRVRDDRWRVEPVEGVAAAELMADAVRERLRHALAAASTEEERVELVNRLVGALEGQSGSGADVTDRVPAPAEALFAVVEGGGLGDAPPRRPLLSVRQSDLVVNGPRDLRLADVIRRELPSADRVDVLVSFILWTGLRLVLPELRAFLLRRPGKLRVITTTYMRTTEPEAVEALLDAGADVRVSYDHGTTRLHAKCWLFHRDSGFSTALLGSSNLSRSALLDGAEWNVRLSAIDNRPLFEKLEATFVQYWQDPSFEPYDRARFHEAIQVRDVGRDALARLVHLRALPHQQAALDALEVERAAGHTRNLVVAATGTGKTVTAALDYARLRRQLPRARLLFVAHRHEILQQSLATYRGALQDGHFGELFDGGGRPVVGDAVFASIQSLNAARVRRLAPDFYDVVVVDEFHHAAAPTYTALLDHLRPRVLLGLTATPERTDGRSILDWFDGRVASELRLWDALDQQLLCPFHYFGLSDGIDLSRVDFRAGRYAVDALERLYTADDVRARGVLREVKRLIRPLSQMRAIGFCVSVKHAEFMARHFERDGISAAVVTGETPTAERQSARRRLVAGEVQCLFTVDVLSEGVDLPEVNAVLLLRPTESALVFQQQLGRGLRRHESKSALTVLDFIGTAHRQFRYDQRFGVLSGRSGARTAKDDVERGFPRLPTGCDIRLDPEAQKAVLDNLRAQVERHGRSGLTDLVRERGDVGLLGLLRDGVTLDEVYSGSGASYGELAERAGLRPTGSCAGEPWKALARLLHVADDARLDAWRELFGGRREPSLDDPLAWMAFAALGFARVPVAELPARLAAVRGDPHLRRELLELLDVLADRRRAPATPCPGLPFAVHGVYSRDEIAAGLRQTRSGKLLRTQGGVYKDDDSRSDVLYVTLDKDERNFTPTTRYRDYPMSDTLFHWESQATTRADGDTGLRYRGLQRPVGWRTLLFVRQKKHDARGETMPFTFLGPAHFESWARDERPMSIVWALETPMPAAFFQEVKLAAG